MRKKLFIITFLLSACSGYGQNFWTPTSILAGGDFVRAMTRAQNGNIIAASFYSGIYRSSNNGVNWINCLTQTGIYNLLTAPDGNVYALYSTVSSINISRSTNNGVNWNQVYTHAISNNYAYGGGIAFFSGGTFVAGLNETIGPLISDDATVVLRSTDAGITWSQVSLQQGLDYNDLTAVGTLVYAASSAIGGSAVVFSSTQGSTWNSTNSFGLGIGEHLRVDGNGSLWVGVWTGEQVTEKLYKSTNGGNNWSPAGLPGGNVLSLFISSSGFIYAGTDAYAPNTPIVRRSTNGGASWQQITSGMPTGEKTYSFTENLSGDIFAGTRNSGVYRGSDIISVQNLNERLPDKYGLEQNYPNPFNPKTVIIFQIVKPGFVRLKIFDISGREIAVIVNERLQPGTYKTEWNADNHPSGVYFYTLLTAGFTETKKMMLTK